MVNRPHSVGPFQRTGEAHQLSEQYAFEVLIVLSRPAMYTANRDVCVAGEAAFQHIPLIPSQVSEPGPQGTKPTERLSDTALLGGRQATMITAVPVRSPRHCDATAVTCSNAHTIRGQLASLMMVVQRDAVTGMTHSFCVKQPYPLTAGTRFLGSVMRHVCLQLSVFR